jgi:hypothetical protein
LVLFRLPFAWFVIHSHAVFFRLPLARRLPQCPTAAVCIFRLAARHAERLRQPEKPAPLFRLPLAAPITAKQPERRFFAFRLLWTVKKGFQAALLLF